jgi:hypothetical protein
MNIILRGFQDIAGVSEPSASTPADFFNEAADLLQHAGNVSKILWPASQKPLTKERGCWLRTVLTINDDHVLADRRLRNHVEHFDERIDEWAVSSKNHNFVDHIIGSRSMVAGESVDDADTFRLYDPQANTFIFRGESFDVQLIADGLKDISTRVLERLKNLLAARMSQVPSTTSKA